MIELELDLSMRSSTIVDRPSQDQPNLVAFDGDVVSVNNDLHLHRVTNTRDEVPHDISGIAWPRSWGLITDQPGNCDWVALQVRDNDQERVCVVEKVRIEYTQ